MTTAELFPELAPAPMPRKLYYWIDIYTEETCPCAATLEAWAAWLAAPCGMFGRTTPAHEGEEFTCSVSSRRDRIIRYTHDEDEGGEWDIVDDCEPYDWGALTWSAGGRWDEEGIFGAIADATDGLDAGQDFDVALMRDLPAIRLRFMIGSDGPALVEIPAQ